MIKEKVAANIVYAIMLPIGRTTHILTVRGKCIKTTIT